MFSILAENLCVDSQAKTWRLKLIDFGSSQTAQDIVTEGLTNEYLSPESCRNILLVLENNNYDKNGNLNEVLATLCKCYDLISTHMHAHTRTHTHTYTHTHTHTHI